MRNIVRGFRTYPALSVGSAVLWGVIEFVALQKTHLVTRVQHKVLPVLR